MKFKLVVFYDDDASLERYLAQYRLVLSETPSIQKRYNGCEIEDTHILIRCVRGLMDSARGHKAHVVAVQEELTWGDKWPEMRDTFLRPILLSPIDIQIFDGSGHAEES